MNLQAVLFDLDGTLANTSPEIAAAVNNTLEQLGLPLSGEEMVASWVGNGARELFITSLSTATNRSREQIVADPNFKAQHEIFKNNYERHCGTQSTLYPGARELIDFLHQYNIPIGLVTNKESNFTQLVIDRLKITADIDCLVCGDTLPKRKPQPDGLLYCAKKLGTTAQRAVYIGDSWIDVATARAASMPIWAMTHGYNRGKPIADENPDLLFDTFTQVTTYIASILATTENSNFTQSSTIQKEDIR